MLFCSVFVGTGFARSRGRFGSFQVGVKTEVGVSGGLRTPQGALGAAFARIDSAL